MTPAISSSTHIIAFIACLTCVTYTSLVLIRALGLQWTIGRFLALAILNCAQIVIVVEVLSLLESIHALNLIFIHCGVGAILLAFKCRPAPLVPYKLREFLRNIFDRSDRALQILLIFTILAGATTFFLALYVPPNNHDGMTYHLARVGYYLQQGSLKSYPTPNIRQTVFPANAEILMLWQMALLRKDTTVAFVQWLSWLGSVLAIYGIARQLRAPPEGALFAALAFASFPEIVLQSTSVQNDLIAAFLLLCAFFFAAEIPRTPFAGVLLAGASIGLAVGTKTLALLMLPGLGIYALALIFTQKGFTRRRVIALFLMSLTGFLVLGSYFYLQNLSHYGHVTGPESIMETHSLDAFEWHVAWSNLGRSLMQLLNPNGIIPPWHSIRQFVGHYYLGFADKFFQYSGIPEHLPGKDFFNASWSDYSVWSMHEDVAMFGPIFGWLGLAILFFNLLKTDYEPEHAPIRALSLAFIVFWLIVTATLRWQVWIGRLMVPMVAIGSPLLAYLYTERKRAWSWIWNVLLVGACVSCLLHSVLLNEMKPIFGPRAIWGKDRIHLMTMNRPGADSLLRFIDQLGLKGEQLGIVPVTVDSFEYPLFGKNLERRLIPIRIDRNESLTLDKLPALNYLLIEGETQEYFPLDQSTKPAGRHFGIISIQPLIDALRNPKSGWRPMLDEDGFMHLFTKKTESVDPSAFSILPEFLPGEWNSWTDHWVKDDFTVRARIDAAKPIIEIQGEAPALGMQPMIRIEGPENRLLGTITLQRSGAFNSTVSLASLSPDYNGKYVGLRFTSNMRFNPEKLGLSNDSRDLSWRLFKLKMKPDTGGPSNTPD